MAAVLVTGKGQFSVTGYAEHNFGPSESVFSQRYEQSSDAHSLVGLEWRIHAHITRWEPNDTLHPRIFVQFKDAGKEGTTTVYSAKVKLSVLLPNGQLVAEREDGVRHHFEGTQFCIDGQGDPELNNFIGPQQQLLCESFIVRADIEVRGDPTILHSPSFHHAIKIGPFEDCRGWRASVAGYHQCLRRLVFWIVRHRLLGHMLGRQPSYTIVTGPTSSTPDRAQLLSSRAALSIDQHLAACVVKQFGYHLYILHLFTNKFLHKWYYIQHYDEKNDSVDGLAHTRRGWIMWVSHLRFYRLPGDKGQMELILTVQAPLCQISANYNSLLASYSDGNRLQVWDLASPELSSQSYDHQLSRVRFMGLDQGDKMFVLELSDQLPYVSAIVSRIELLQNGCRVHSYYRLAHKPDYIVFEEEKMILVKTPMENRNREIVVQTVWTGGHIPTAKEMATIEIQKRTGRQEMMETALGEQSVWQGGITEHKIREILNIIFKRKPVPIMN